MILQYVFEFSCTIFLMYSFKNSLILTYLMEVITGILQISYFQTSLVDGCRLPVKMKLSDDWRA